MSRIAAALLTVVVLAAPALAGPYFVQVTGTANQYDMSTVNDYLDTVNDDAGAQIIDHLDSGGAWGVDLGQVYNRNLAASIGYERLYASIRSTPPPLVMHIQAPANIISFKLAYALARWGTVIPFVQCGGGLIWNNGYLEYQDEFGNNRRHDFKGTTLALEGLVGVEVRLSDRYGLNVSGGYRLADVSSPDWDADSFGGYGTFTGPGFDYSGVMVRAGLRIGLNWTVGTEDADDEGSKPPVDTTGWM